MHFRHVNPIVLEQRESLMSVTPEVEYSLWRHLLLTAATFARMKHACGNGPMYRNKT